jgi:hypothetical protein
VTLNGSAAGETHLQPRTWTANGAPQPGFVRIDPKSPKRFAFDNGQRYFPIGHNVGLDEQTLIFPKMGAVGENWSRVWMAHWAGANLDWQMNEKLTLGHLSLAAARRWDAIADSAERHGIYFQLVLQHHGQYSTSTNPNWDENPWNAKNGGFLNTPEEFFTSERAKELTRRKYRYIIARWSYSPHIMAWELFNEVHWTNAMRNGKEATFVAWHNEMADFLRANDPFHHLLTTSDTSAGAGIFEKMDYLQHHDYPNDLIASAATRGTSIPSDKPQFGGEVGTGDESSDHQLRAVLYAGLMAGESGAAQPWWWDAFERNNQYSVFGSLVRFARFTNIGMHDAAQSFVVPTASKERIDLQLQPGAGWAPVKQREFTLSGSGAPAGFEQFPAYFYNQDRQDMNGGPLTFNVNNAKPGSMTIHTDQISEKGAHLVVSVDGQKQAERSYPGKATKEQLTQPLSVQVPAGKHSVTVVNTGADWVHIRDFTFTGMATPLTGYGLAEPRWAAL